MARSRLRAAGFTITRVHVKGGNWEMTAVSRAGEGYYVGDLAAVEEIIRVAGDDQD